MRYRPLTTLFIDVSPKWLFSSPLEFRRRIEKVDFCIAKGIKIQKAPFCPFLFSSHAKTALWCKNIRRESLWRQIRSVLALSKIERADFFSFLLLVRKRQTKGVKSFFFDPFLPSLRKWACSVEEAKKLFTFTATKQKQSETRNKNSTDSR